MKMDLEATQGGREDTVRRGKSYLRRNQESRGRPRQWRHDREGKGVVIT